MAPNRDMPYTYAARPTVRIDTQEYPLVGELIVAFAMAEQEGGMSSLELRLSGVASTATGGTGLAFEDDAILRLGGRISLYGGDVTAPTELFFEGVITALELEFPEDGPPELVVLAEDLFQQARLTRRTQTYTDTTLAELADEFAGRLGLTAVVTGFTQPIGTQVQLNESDLAFLRRVLARFDGDMQLVGRELHLAPRREVRRGEMVLELHEALRSVRVTADLAHQVSAVTLTGWDAGQGRRFDVRSNSVDLEPGRGRTGSAVLEQVLTERNHHVAHLAASDEEEAQALADAVHAAHARRFLHAEGTAEGDPALRVGTYVTLQGLGPRFSNTYYVTRTTHRWDTDRGYETDFEAECAFWGGR
jgi:uncharacterized protein